MATAPSFAELMKQAFIQLSKEQQTPKQEVNEDSHVKEEIAPKQEVHEDVKEEEAEKEEEEEEETDVSNLQHFVVSLLKFAPKRRMLLSELSLKMSETLDRSIRQICGLKSNAFFDAMQEKQLIEIETKETEDASLTFVKLPSKQKIKTETKPKIKTETKPKIETPIMSHPPKAPKKPKTFPQQKQMDNRQTSDAANPWVHDQPKPAKTVKKENKTQISDEQAPITCEQAIEVVRCAILRNFLQSARKQIYLSSINTYCKKYTGVAWKDIMTQTTREFINEMVFDGLVTLEETWKNGNRYDIVKLNKDSDAVKRMTVASLSKTIDRCGRPSSSNTRKRERESEGQDAPPPAKRAKVEKMSLKINSAQELSIAQQIIDKFKRSGDKKNIHFHFEMDQ